MECLELEQFDDDSWEQLQQIELLEQEEEINQKRHYTEMQTQLEQLEQEQESEQLEQILDYEWMLDSESLKEKVLLWQPTDLSKIWRQSIFFNGRHDIIHSNAAAADDDDENQQEDVLTTFLHRIQQQQQQQQQENEEEGENDVFVLARTSKDKSYFPTIQSRLNTSTIIKRRIKHTNVLYICSEEQWKRKVNNYMQQSGVFSLIGDMTSETPTNDAKQILMKMSNLVVKTLHKLLYRRAITNEQYSDMMYYNQSIRFEVNKLDFIPKIRDNKIVVQPMIKCSTVEPMKGILHFVNNLLQSLIEDKFHSKTFPTANEAIETLNRYVSEDHLRPTTFFVTIHIHNLRTTLPHHLMIEALHHFFQYYVHSKQINGISTTTIVQFIQLILENQFCIYENKLYQQIIGSSINSPLITTLIDIYLFYWQHDLLHRLDMPRNRFFGRCLNQICFVWNESKDQLFTFLNQKHLTDSKHAPIQMTVSIGYKIQYLDAEISHIQGILQTRVYHHSNFEPYTLPYLSKTRTSSQSNVVLLRAALIRAILYCSNVREFENERFYIELSFLFNSVSLHFIQNIIENFFIEFHVDKRNMCMDQDTYQFLRYHVRGNYQRHSEYHVRQRQRERERLQQWLY